jgi:hypothetical protein
VSYRLTPPPDAATVVAEAIELVAKRQTDEADRRMEAAVHAGCHPSALLAAALERGATDEAERRRRADALAAKQARLAAGTPERPPNRPGAGTL